MGFGSSKIGDTFPVASREEIAALRDQGVLLCVALPKSDVVEGHHNLSTVYYAEYENGTELTLHFTKDTNGDSSVRKSLFGQKCDLVTLFVMKDGTVEFPNTYSGKQTWDTKRAKHHQASVDLSAFEQKYGNLLLVWVNTANHLLSENNTNFPTEEGEAYQAFFCRPASNQESATNTTDYVIRKASRDEVDKHYKGIVTSVTKLITPAGKKQLGKRVS